MQAILGYVVARLKEPSTWAGFAGIALAVGITAPEWATITQIGVYVAGALAVFIPAA